MDKRQLGTSDLNVSVLGLGCWPLGGGTGWGEEDERQSIATIHRALELGINFFDTAEAYNDGRSEEIVGKALADRRDRALIATKVSAGNCSPEVLRRSCEDSLRRLQTDYVDLYQVHWPIREYPVDEAMATLERLRDEGKVRYVGVSNHGVQDLAEALSTGVQIASNQLHYSLAARAIEAEILPKCRREGIGVIAYMALMQGILAGIYDSADDVPPFRARLRHFSSDRPGARHHEEGAEEELFEALDRIREIAESVGASMAQVSLAWVMAQPGIGCVLIGGRKPDQLARNLGAAELALSEDVVEALSEATEVLRCKLGNNPDYWQSGEESRVR